MQGTQNYQNNFEKEAQSRSHILNFKTYYREVAIKTMQSWHRTDIQVNGIVLSG